MNNTVIKELEIIDINSLLEFYKSIENKISWYTLEGKSRQSSLQFNNNSEEYIAGCGKTKGDDFNFNILSDIYKNTFLETVINKYKLVRTRWMWIEPYACYSIHRDVFPRIHIPIITNNECYFLFPDCKDKILHTPVGKIYWVNTLLKHTVVNCSNIPRLHLVGSTTLS